MTDQITPSEQDLERAEEYRNRIHEEALERVRAVYPNADEVIDQYSADEYFQTVWDYPGAWYLMVGSPADAGGREKLIVTIVRETIAYYRNKGIAHTDNEFHRLIAEYPDLKCKYCIISAENRHAKASGAFPYRGADSHRLALECAARELFGNGQKWPYDMTGARCRKLSSKALFAPVKSDQWLNYRKAFLFPPEGNTYKDKDFDRVNTVLFPGGTEGLEVFRWTTEWSNYFGAGHEWWGSLCLTVYNKMLDRFVVIMASARD